MHSEYGSSRAARKDEHLDLALLGQRDRPPRNGFDDVEFMHHALDGVDPERVDLGVSVGGWRWNAPFYINGMTGGTRRTERVNRELAIAARETGLPMASGSVSVGLEDPDAARGFSVIREENPSGFVMANLAAGSLPDTAARAVDLLEADALQLHVNAVQETVMPEGTRDFSSWIGRLAAIVEASPVPVVVKEVGFGLSRRTLVRLSEVGVRIADVSGTGGTDFVKIENSRRPEAEYGYLEGFGQSAPACLLDAPGDGPQLLASGGVRHPFDVVKALALGARAVGVAGVFLTPAADGGAEPLTRLIRSWLDQTTSLLALLGAETPAALTGTDVIVRGHLGEFCDLRGIDRAALARRSSLSQHAPRTDRSTGKA